MEKFFVGFGKKQNDYVINDVRYSVSSEFMPSENNVTLTDKVEHYLDSYFTDLTDISAVDTISDDYVCSTVGEEDK